MSEIFFDELSGWPNIFHEAKADPVSELCDATEERNYPAAYSALRRLEKPLSGVEACQCLTHALSCTPRLFREILERCEPGEYAWSKHRLPHPGRADLHIYVDGTILVLAAAMNRPRHMEILLEKGWDVNSTAPASEQTRYRTRSYGSDRDICCSKWNELWDGPLNWEIKHGTPLAAAIVCGSEDAVKTLLKRGGVKKLESAAVGLACVIALNGSPEQRACLRLALGLRSGADDPNGMAREFFCEYMPDVDVIAELCTSDEFVLRLDAAPCRPERLRAAVETLTGENRLLESGTAADRDKKIFALLDRYPELEKEQGVKDRMLNAILSRILAKKPCKRLLERWKAACGGIRDLTGVESDLIDRMEQLDANGLHGVFSGLDEEKNSLLCTSSESAWFYVRRGKRFLALCLDHLKVYRTEGDGVSEVAQSLIRLGDARLLRKAAESGALRGENREEMLALMSKEKSAPALRALTLTLPGDQIGVASARPQPEDEETWRQWKVMDDKQRAAFLRQMWEEPLCAEECRKRLRAYKWSREDLDWLMLLYTEVDGMDIDNMTTAACCGRNPELLRVLLEEGEVDTKERIQWSWQNPCESLYCTVLCLAAAAGRTEQVRCLLDMGLDPNEDDMPVRSTYQRDTCEATQVVTPLYIALLKGHSETAELLRQRGGYAYPAE